MHCNFYERLFISDININLLKIKCKFNVNYSVFMFPNG